MALLSQLEPPDPKAMLRPLGRKTMLGASSGITELAESGL